MSQLVKLPTSEFKPPIGLNTKCSLLKKKKKTNSLSHYNWREEEVFFKR